MNDEVSRDDDRDPAEDSARTPRDDEPRGGARKACLFSRMFGKQPQPSATAQRPSRLVAYLKL